MESPSEYVARPATSDDSRTWLNRATTWVRTLFGVVGRFVLSLSKPAVYLLIVATGSLLLVLRRADEALSQMRLEGGISGSALDFPVSLDLMSNVSLTRERMETLLASWRSFDAEIALAGGPNGEPGQLREATAVANDLVVLDSIFVVLYALLLALIIARLGQSIREVADDWGILRFRENRYHRVLRRASVLLALLVAADLLENIQLYRAFAGEPQLWHLGVIALGPITSATKLILAGFTLLAVGFVGAAVLVGDSEFAAAVKRSRAILGFIGLLTVLLFFGIIAKQAEDVIRAWTFPAAAFATLAALLLALLATWAVHELTGPGAPDIRPDVGKSPQLPLLGAGVALLLIGQLMRVVGLGWGLSVAGGLLLLLWALSVPLDGLFGYTDSPEVDRPHDEGAANDDQASDKATEPEEAARIPAPEEADAPPGTTDTPPGSSSKTVQRWGELLGRFAGLAVLAVLSWVVVRAVALDLVARRPLDWGVLSAPLVGAGAGLTAGAIILLLTAERGRSVRVRAPFTVVPLLFLLALGFDPVAVDLPERVGSVAVIYLGFAVIVGLIGVLANAFERGAQRWRQTAALQALRLKRFPAIAFLVVWVIVVSVLDAGSHHDIRRYDTGVKQPVPTIGTAWRQWVAAHEADGRPQPMVMVAAQGGGLRAAVWTALVMECIFGPGPVPGSNLPDPDSEPVCTHGAEQPDPKTLAAAVDAPTSVFVTSGASGGSVGLAAWSARRADLVDDQDTAQIPVRVEDALDNDFVAPVAARMLTADLPYMLLAWDRADRAEMLEAAWEQAWFEDGAPQGKGLNRGLRSMWNLTHAGGAWATPVLALNGFSVEDGCRMVTSAVDFALPRDPASYAARSVGALTSEGDQPDDAACRGPERPTDATAVDVLPSTSELIDYLCPTEDVTLSTAAHLSARFPYVSPTGRITRSGCENAPGLVDPPAVSYNADGGIFDNSGAGTLTDLWRGLAPVIAAFERENENACIAPVMLQIDNSPPVSTVSSGPDARPAEVVAPVSATLRQVTSRESYARASAAAAFGRPLSPSGQPITWAVNNEVRGDAPRTLWFRVTVFGQPGPEPPTGWTLATETVADMRAQLRVDQNAEQIKVIQDLLASGALTCE